MEKKKKQEYWLFVLMTNYKSLLNCYFEHFPTEQELMALCREKNGSQYVIVSMTKLTKEQYMKLRGIEDVSER